MPFSDQPEARFRYYDDGRKGGVPFIFLHGLGASIQQPLELLEDLPGVRLLSMDFRGHGLTEYAGPPSGYQIRVFADDAMALLDQLGIEKAFVGGVSLGAAVAINMAIRRPEQFSPGLVIVRPAWLNQPFPLNLDLLVRIGRWVEIRGVEGARAQLLEEPNFKEIQSRSPQAAESLLGQLRRPQLAEAYEALMRLPASVPFLQWEDLQAATMPSMVVYSARDPLHPFIYGKQLAERLPKAKFQQVVSRYDDAVQHRQQVRAAIQQFVGRRIRYGGPF